MLLSTLETTIVSTSLVSMVNELQGFGQAGWVITAYFLTYTGEHADISILFFPPTLTLLTALLRVPRHLCEAQRYLRDEAPDSLCRHTLCHILRCMRSFRQYATAVSGQPQRNDEVGDADSPRIIFRSIQGVGGSGIYSLVTVMTPLMVPPAKYPTYIALISSVFAISSVLGPVLGGVISDQTTWRWVFWLKCVASPSRYSVSIIGVLTLHSQAALVAR
jgi:hypothetical protein